MLKIQRPVDEIPTSPMADIAFLLVIYFMVTVTFAATQGLDFGVSEDEPDTPIIDPVASILVEVLPDGTVEVDGTGSTVEGMWGLIEPKLRREPDKPVLLRARSGAVYGQMVTAFDRLRRAPDGFDQPLQIVVPTEREIERLWS